MGFFPLGIYNQMKNNKYHTVGTDLKLNHHRKSNKMIWIILRKPQKPK
jgi:hypothetical protein